MATLTKDCLDRSPYWICCYRAADGRRLKKSTKQADHSKAMEFCLALERAEGMAARGTLTETRARELIGEVLERTIGEEVAFFTVEGWLQHWLNGKKIAKAEGTYAKYAHMVESFIKHLGTRAKLNIAAVGPKDIASFRDAQIKSGKSANTVRFSVRKLSIPFNAARRQGLITVNPVEAVELPATAATKSDSESTRDAFTTEQVEALLKAAVAREHGRQIFEAGEDWHGAILFAYFTGARLHDVANIAWGGIDLPARTITFRAKKTGKLVTVPMHAELETYFLSQPAPDNERAFVFPKLAGRGTGGRSGLSMTFARIMARAKVAGEILQVARKGEKGRTVRSLTFHSLRHSFNSVMANAGVSQEVRMKLTGHATAVVNTGYTHHELEPLRAAIQTIPAIQRTAKG